MPSKRHDPRYSLHPRPRKRSRTGEIFYAQFKLPSGKWSSAKCTHQETITAAHTWAAERLASGQITDYDSLTFGQIAAGFFDDDGPYATHKRLRNKRVSPRSLSEQRMHLENHVMPWFTKKRLATIDYDEISEYQIAKLKSGLSGDSVNKHTTILKAVLEYAVRKRYIARLPLIERVGVQSQPRGILSLEEVQALLNSPLWDDYRCYVANVTAATTGLRAGEIVALQRQDVREKYLHVRHSYNETWGLQPTKTRKTRNVRIPTFTERHIKALLEENPFKRPEAFVFASHRADRPMNARLATAALRKALVDMMLDPADRGDKEKREAALETIKARRIDFHSWRHWYNSFLLDRGVSAERVRALTGHSTAAMTENYFHASEFEDVAGLLDSSIASPGGAQ